MNNGLVFEYEHSRDGDDFGWLITRVVTPAFQAENGMWVQWQDLLEFGQSLSAYPIPSDQPLTGEWGVGEHGEYQAITSVAVAPEGTTGGLIADVFLANYYDPRHRCQTRFLTDYPSLDRFRFEIVAMMGRERPSATLTGSVKDRD